MSVQSWAVFGLFLRLLYVWRCCVYSQLDEIVVAVLEYDFIIVAARLMRLRRCCNSDTTCGLTLLPFSSWLMDYGMKNYDFFWEQVEVRGMSILQLLIVSWDFIDAYLYNYIDSCFWRCCSFWRRFTQSTDYDGVEQPDFDFLWLTLPICANEEYLPF